MTISTFSLGIHAVAAVVQDLQIVGDDRAVWVVTLGEDTTA